MWTSKKDDYIWFFSPHLGQVVIPNNVWEPGEAYSLKMDLELNGKYFLFFLPIYYVHSTDSLNWNVNLMIIN